MTKGIKMAWADPIVRKRNTIAQRAAMLDPVVRGHQSEAQKKAWADPNRRRKHSENAKRSHRVAAHLARQRLAAKPNGSERRLYGLLDEVGVPYLKEHKIGTYFADVFVQSRNLVIECDGYWHSRKLDYYGKRDAFMRGLGFTVLRLPSGKIDSGIAKASLFLALGIELSV